MPNYTYILPIVLLLLLCIYWGNRTQFDEGSSEYITFFDDNEIVYNRQTEKHLIPVEVPKAILNPKILPNKLSPIPLYANQSSSNISSSETESTPEPTTPTASTTTTTTKETSQPKTTTEVSSTAESLEPETTLYSYNAEAEIEKRRESLKKYCEEKKKPPGFRTTPSFRTGYVSKWGISLGGVNFWSCFTPKCASTSFSVAVLAATGQY